MATARLYSFISMNLPANTFHVVRYTGQEEISRPYFFDIDLVSEKPDLRMEDVTEGNARLAINYASMKLRYHGLVYRFEHLRSVDRSHYYKALLAPRLWALSMNRHSQVFVDKTLPEILEQVLLESGMLSALDLDFRLSASYPRREYVCQYNESHFNFFSRWCEREGIYYFFEQQDSGERLVLTDSLMAHQPLPRQPVLRYRPVSGLEPGTALQIATSFVCEQNLVPQSVQLRDYNYRHASLNLDSGVEPVAQGDVGAVYTYGENVKSLDEAKHIAQVRAQEATAGQTVFKGVGRAPFIRSGFLFTLADHPDTSRNIEYLTTRVRRIGNQESYLADSLGIAVPEREGRRGHSISFTAIAANVQYRPKRSTPWPRFHGAMNATVESEGSSDYAHLDEQGRYKVRLPFDVSHSAKGRASAWIRMGQPYGGSGHGMHFPLLDGTEVLLAFIDGDVDRPVITAALPNVETPSIVKSGNAPANAIRSASGNQLVFGDQKGQEFVGLFSTHASSGISIGSHKPGGGGSIAIASHGVFDEFTGGGKIGCSLGSVTDLVLGVESSVTVGIRSDVTAAIATEAALMSQVSYTRGDRIELGSEAMTLKKDMALVGLEGVVISGGINKTVAGLVKKAKLAVGLGIAASIASGVGIAAMSRPFDKEFLEDAKVEWKAGPGVAAGGVTTAVGLVLAAFCAATVKKVAKSYETASNNAKTANITLDKNGIGMKINSKVHGPANLDMAVLAEGVTSTEKQMSSITIEQKGINIKIKNKGTAKVNLLNGQQVNAIVQNDDGKVNTMMVTKNEVTLWKFDGGYIQALGDKAQVTCNKSGVTPGAFTAKLDEAHISCSNSSSISVKSDEVAVSSPKANITVTGALTLSGGSINIG